VQHSGGSQQIGRTAEGKRRQRRRRQDQQDQEAQWGRGVKRLGGGSSSSGGGSGTDNAGEDGGIPSAGNVWQLQRPPWAAPAAPAAPLLPAPRTAPLQLPLFLSWGKGKVVPGGAATQLALSGSAWMYSRTAAAADAPKLGGEALPWDTFWPGLGGWGAKARRRCVRMAGASSVSGLMKPAQMLHD
jgi:hypothetical protein